MKILRSLSLILVFGGLLGGCARQTTVAIPEITFTHLQPLMLSVSQIRVEESFVPSQTPPHIETRINPSLVQVLRRWVGDRLAVGEAVVSSGSTGSARFVIVDAGVTERALDTDGNFTAYFTNEQALRYDASVEALLEIKSVDGMSQGSAVARATRFVTVPEEATLNERELAMFNLVEGLMKEFNERMDESIRAHLSKWLP